MVIVFPHRNHRLFIDRQLKHIGPRVVADHVKIVLRPHDVTQVQLGVEDAFSIEQRPGDHVAQRRYDHAAPAAHNLRLAGQILDPRQVGRVHRLGHVLVAAEHEAAALARDVAQRGLPGIAAVGGGGQVMGKMVIILIAGLTITVGIMTLAITRRSGDAHNSAMATFTTTQSRNIASSAAEYYVRQLKAAPSLRGTFALASILGGSAVVTLSDWSGTGTDSVRLVSVGSYQGMAETSLVCLAGGPGQFPMEAALEIRVPNLLTFSYSGTLAIDGRDHDLTGAVLPASGNDRPGIGLSNAAEVSKILPGAAAQINGTTDVASPVSPTNPQPFVADLVSRANFTYTGSNGSSHVWGSAAAPVIVYCAPTAMKFTNQCTGYGILLIDATTFESTNKFTWYGLVIQYSTASNDCRWKTSNTMKVYGGLLIYARNDNVYQSTGVANIYRSTAGLNLAQSLFTGGGSLGVVKWFE